MKRPPRIAFMTTVNHNVGDEFIREGIRSFLDEVIGDYDPYYVHKHDLATLHTPLLNEPELLGDKFRECDIIVQAGAPVYWAFDKYRCYNVEWAQELWYDRIFKLGPAKPILNLGAGSCQGDERDIQPLLDDPKCAEFAREAARACRITTVRDPLASEFLKTVGIQHDLLACPAFHAARRWGKAKPARWLAINLMERAGHQVIKPQDPQRWPAMCAELVRALRKKHQLIFVAHDKAEADFQQRFVEGDETLFFSPHFHNYIEVYSQAEAIVANRVHGAVCVAGFGRPAMIVGNDSRIGIARPIGIPACDVNEASVDWIVNSLQSELARAGALFDERVSLREESARQYIAKLADIL